MREIIVLGGGCFWCTEAVFRELKGVLSVTSGYAGGNMPRPTYEQVCTGTTGHAEVIRVTYDSSCITTDDLLTVFFATHNPTTLHRQGNDVGTQYRSIILYTNEQQKRKAVAYIKNVQSDFGDTKIVTEIKPLETFYEAEEDQKEFYARNQNAPYCRAIIDPKLKKLKSAYKELIRDNK